MFVPNSSIWLQPILQQEIQNLIKIIGLDLNKESFCSGPRMTKDDKEWDKRIDVLGEYSCIVYV